MTVSLLKNERGLFMYKKYLELAKGSFGRVKDLEAYAKQVLYEDIQKVTEVSSKVRRTPNIENREGRIQQAKDMIALAYLQKVGVIKEARRDALNEVIQAAQDAKAKMPKATPEQLAEYKDRVNDLKTELMFTLDHDTKEAVIKEFINQIDNPDLATELRREFGNITRDAMNSVSDVDKSKIQVFFQKYYADLKDGINFYPEDIKETIKLARNAEERLVEDRLYNRVYAENYVSQLINNEQLVYIENTDQYFEQNYPELMETNIGDKLDRTIERDILAPDTKENVRAAAVSSLLR
jgi:hypothetical protein